MEKTQEVKVEKIRNFEFITQIINDWKFNEKNPWIIFNLLVDEFVIKLDYLGRKKESGDGFLTYLNKADFEKKTEGYITSCYQSSVIDVVNAFYDELFDKDKIQQLKTLQGELEKTQEVEVEIIREIN